MREYKITCNKCGKEISEAQIATFKLCGDKFRPAGCMWRDNINKKLVDIELCESCAKIVYGKIYNLTTNFDTKVSCPKDDTMDINKPYVHIGSNYIYSLRNVDEFIQANSIGFKLIRVNNRRTDGFDQLVSIEFRVGNFDDTDFEDRVIENLQDFKDLFIDYFPDTPIEYFKGKE